ncbi:hypothetical protein SERLA73DRAFT_47874 [Serpula lacrymans var. lacrymans S7.3]|uniref:Aminodeoxychorismate lyase n=1 Tax=Serpula lacrymans var. lacrymans (strain S7.3) TaxID=936435 RepID=F8PM43_SERL3|nr:hypothetical protein SERLA73DRAFT_47874 [Serpula lacrymans var. lacrymans S7.3]
MPFSLLSCTRYDPYLQSLKWNNDNAGNPSPYLLLSYHSDRLADAARIHGWGDVQPLTPLYLKSVCDKAVQEYGDKSPPFALKVRLVLTQTGDLSAAVAPIAPLSSDPTAPTFFNPLTDAPTLFVPVFHIQLDSQSTPSSVFTSTKTTTRKVYDDARSRAGVSSPSITRHTQHYPPDDVLLFNSQNDVTEASIYNVAFYRSSQWVTPPMSTGCLPGVLRRWLLEQGRISEAQEHELSRDGVKQDEWVLLFNGVQGCRLGRVTIFVS